MPGVRQCNVVRRRRACSANRPHGPDRAVGAARRFVQVGPRMPPFWRPEPGRWPADCHPGGAHSHSHRIGDAEEGARGSVGDAARCVGCGRRRTAHAASAARGRPRAQRARTCSECSTARAAGLPQCGKRGGTRMGRGWGAATPPACNPQPGVVAAHWIEFASQFAVRPLVCRKGHLVKGEGASGTERKGELEHVRAARTIRGAAQRPMRLDAKAARRSNSGREDGIGDPSHPIQHFRDAGDLNAQ